MPAYNDSRNPLRHIATVSELSFQYFSTIFVWKWSNELSVRLLYGTYALMTWTNKEMNNLHYVFSYLSYLHIYERVIELSYTDLYVGDKPNAPNVIKLTTGRASICNWTLFVKLQICTRTSSPWTSPYCHSVTNCIKLSICNVVCSWNSAIICLLEHVCFCSCDIFTVIVLVGEGHVIDVGGGFIVAAD